MILESVILILYLKLNLKQSFLRTVLTEVAVVVLLTDYFFLRMDTLYYLFLLLVIIISIINQLRFASTVSTEFPTHSAP